MNLQDLGAMGELVGGIAVVITVIYLALQIRHGISGYKSHAILEITHHFSNLQLEIAKSELLLEAWYKAEKREPLNPMEQRCVLGLVSSWFIGFENMHTQYRNNMMEKSDYDARRPIFATFMTFTGVYDWWKTLGRFQHPPEFVADVEQALKDYNIELPAESR